MSGGSSLSSILWFRDERPEIWAATAKFGHCNTYLVKRMTGRWAIDPSTTSITGLYNTARNDLTWNQAVLASRASPRTGCHRSCRPTSRSVRCCPQSPEELGLPRGCAVLCGGNDAVLAALSGGLTEPGDINIISGTCDIANVCTDRPIASRNLQRPVPCRPGRWLTFFVLNAGGEALEWFRRIACSELRRGEFYGEYLPACSRGSSGVRTRTPVKPSSPSTCRTSAAAGTPSNVSRAASAA